MAKQSPGRNEQLVVFRVPIAEFEAAGRCAFVKTYKPVLDDATYRPQDSMVEYRCRSAHEGKAMVIHLSPQLEATLAEQARQRSVTPEALALETLRERFLPKVPAVEPQDEWERRLFGAAIDCGVSVPDSALSSDGLYE